MLEKPSISDQVIIDCLNAHYGIEVITLTFLPLGADANASVYKVDARNQSSYFVKLKRGYDHNIGLVIVGLLHEAGIQQVIFPLKTVDSQSSQCIDNFTLIIYPYIEAENGFHRVLTDEQWLTLGKTLKQVHDIDVPSSIQQELRREAYSPKWREIVRSFYTLEVEQIGDEIAQKLFQFIKENQMIINHLVDRAEQLALVIQNESPKFVLCHSDIHGGNVLIDSSNALYIVDWDDPIMAPKERDLMFIGGGVGNVWNKLHEESLFYKGYGKTDINMAILAYYRYERIVVDIAEFGQGLFLTAEGGENRAVMYEHFMGMFEPNGVIDIVFETDDGFRLQRI